MVLACYDSGFSIPYWQQPGLASKLDRIRALHSTLCFTTNISLYTPVYAELGEAVTV
jgi:hypothetical protein